MYTIFITLFNILHSLLNADAFINKKLSGSNDIPFIVSIGTNNNHICGGALISRKHILTSEQCVFDKKAKNLQVLIGNNDLLCSRKYDVESIMRFDDWTKRHHSAAYPNNDVAILTLKNEVTGVEPGLLDERSRNPEFYGKNVITAGWQEDDHGNLSRYLQKSVLKVLTPDQCNKNLYKLTGSRYEVNEKYLCTTATSNMLLDKGTEGSPILHNNLIIGVNHGKFLDFTEDHSVEQNLHVGIEHYRRFINDVLSND